MWDIYLFIWRKQLKHTAVSIWSLLDGPEFTTVRLTDLANWKMYHEKPGKVNNMACCFCQRTGCSQKKDLIEKLMLCYKETHKQTHTQTHTPPPPHTHTQIICCPEVTVWMYLFFGSGKLTEAVGGFLPSQFQFLPKFFISSHQLMYVGFEVQGWLRLPSHAVNISSLLF